MTDPTITRDDVAGRSRVDDLAASSPREALKVARKIRHPWYRCQSLSTVAEHWGTQQQKIELLEEALTAAQELHEVNRVVTVSSWPIRVLAMFAPEFVQNHLIRLVTLAETEEHSLRRADALYALVTAVSQAPELAALVLPSLRKALLAGQGWRIDRLIRWTVEMFNGSMPEDLEGLLEHHSDGAKKRKLIDSLRSDA